MCNISRKVVYKLQGRKVEDKNTSVPTQFRIGKTYYQPGGGSITITNIYVSRVHLDEGGEAYLEYSYISPEGKKGKEANPVSAIQKWYGR